MSFEELAKSNYAPKTEEVKIKHGDKDFVFTANEISFLQRLNLSGLQSVGGDSYSQLVVYSIKDQDGRHMTLNQVQSLHPDIQEKFFVAAARVNSAEDAKKKDN